MLAATAHYNMANISELIHGRKPDVAPFEPTDPLEELGKLIRGEISSWDDITRLGDLYQSYMMDAYETSIPGFADILKQGGADTLSLLQSAAPLIKGELPEDVKQQVLRSSAFQSLGSTGTSSPQFLQSLQGRDLGRTSLDLMTQGANLLGAGGNAAQRWQSIASSTILPPSESMYSPAWFSTFMAQQRAAKQATKQFKYNVEAAPDPAWKDRAELLAQYGGMALGGGMGGGGGGQGYTMGSDWSSNIGQGVGNYQVNVDPRYGGFNTPTVAPPPDYKNVVEPLPQAYNQSFFNWGYGGT